MSSDKVTRSGNSLTRRDFLGGTAFAAGLCVSSPFCFSEVMGRSLTQRERIDRAIPGGNERMIKRVGWCTGGAQGYIDKAVAANVDAYISGEISEPTVHIARECGIHYFSAGHHATERYGVMALGDKLASTFGLEHEFVDIDNPV